MPSFASIPLRPLGRLSATKAAEDKSVRSIVIRGQGTVFSAGHNLKEMTADMGYDYHMKIFDTCEKMMLLVNQV